MPNAVEIVKRAAVDAMEASKPVHIVFGQVISTAPLRIQVDQKTIYTAKMLVLTRNVTNYYINGAEPVYNALQVGERVVLVRMQGGKKFLVLDRLGA